MTTRFSLAVSTFISTLLLVLSFPSRTAKSKAVNKEQISVLADIATKYKANSIDDFDDENIDPSFPVGTNIISNNETELVIYYFDSTGDMPMLLEHAESRFDLSITNKECSIVFPCGITSFVLFLNRQNDLYNGSYEGRINISDMKIHLEDIEL